MPIKIRPEDLAQLDQHSLKRIKLIIDGYYNSRKFLESLIAKSDLPREGAIKELIKFYKPLGANWVHEPSLCCYHIARQLLDEFQHPKLFD